MCDLSAPQPDGRRGSGFTWPPYLDPIYVGAANYLSHGTPDKAPGPLIVSQRGVRFTCKGPTTVVHQYRPQVDLLIPWHDVCDIRVERETMSSVNVGAIAAFGVLGLGARERRAVTRLTFVTTTGEHAFDVDSDPSIISNRLQPIINTVSAKGVDTVATAGLGVSVADELRKLVALRDEGVLTAEEFEAQKARLLAG
jgi:hypothetical protein